MTDDEAIGQKETHGGVVLVVDDDEDTRETLKDILEDEGCRVELAKHGREALERLAAGPRPCFILLDVMMPVMTGIEFLDVLRKDPDYATTPVVLISAWSDRVGSIEGIQGYASKPFNLEEIFAFARRFCLCDTNRSGAQANVSCEHGAG